MDEPPKENRSEMVGQLSNIAQFCDDLAFVIAARRSVQNAAVRRCGVLGFRRHCATAFHQQIDRKNLGQRRKNKLRR
jgi:hypothetical protein